MTEWTDDEIRVVEALMAQGMGRQHRLDGWSGTSTEADDLDDGGAT